METDQILSRTSLKPTAPEFVPSSVCKTTPTPAKMDEKEMMPVAEVKPLPRPEVPETVPESPEDSDDDVHVVLHTETAMFRPPMRHRDTADSIESTDSDRSADSPVRDKDDSANLGDRSDSGSEAGSLPGHDGDTSDQDGDDRVRLRPDQVAVKVVDKKDADKKEASTDEDLPPFVAPDEELSKRIVDQVEFYFSDVNITKDAFLLKHVKRNKEGYVSLKLISSFKRVKHIARDWRVVAYALRQSTKLEINEAGTKLRRMDPLPAYDQTTPSRTVVAINLPHDKPTIESVAELFRPCGDIALVRILRPGNPIPADVRSFVTKHPEMHGVVSALVEFVRTESALAAASKRDWDWRYAAGDLSGMRVLELNAPAAPPAPTKKRNAKKNILGKVAADHDYSSCQSDNLQQRRGSSPLDTIHSKHWLQRRYSRDSGCEDGYGYHRAPSSGSLYGSGSEYSRSRSNSSASFDMTANMNTRRMSAGWDSGSESCCSGMGSGRSSRSNSAAFILDSMTRRCSAGKDSDSDGYGSFRSRKSSGASDLSSVGRRDSGGPCHLGPQLGRRGSGALDEEVYVPARRGSSHHLEHQLLRRMAALGLSEHQGHLPAHHHDCCSCSCSRPPPIHDCHGSHGPHGHNLPRRGSAELSRKPMLFAQAIAAATSNAQPEHAPVRRTSGAGVPENITRMPRGPDGGRGFTRENDIPEVC